MPGDDSLTRQGNPDATRADDASGAVHADDDGVAAPDLSGFTAAMLEEDGHRPGVRRRRMSAEHVARIRRRRRRRIVVAIIAAAALALIGCAAWLGWSALHAKRGVEKAVAAASGISQAMGSGDAEAARQAIARFSEGVDEAWVQTSGPLWSVPAAMPYYGDDVRAARGAIDVLHDVSVEALPRLANAAGNLNVDAIGVHDATVSMPGLAASATDLGRAATTLADAAVELDNLPTPHVARLADALETAKDGFAQVGGLVDTFARIAQTVPGMLDLDGADARTYLVIAQNNAEARPTGGLPASWGTLEAKGGRLTLSDFVPETTLPLLDEPVVEETTEELGLFGTNLTTKPHDVNFTPDYPRAARIAQAMWTKAKGQEVDGVIMVDPVLLQDLLKVTGGLKVTAGTAGGTTATTLDGTNTVSYLLHDSYYQGLTPDEQDALFSTVARDAFRHVLSSASNGGSAALLRAVMDSTADGHLKVWSAHADEQRHLSGSAIAGELEGKPAEPTVGVYYSDGTQGKMGWYLDRKATATQDGTTADGAARHKVDVTLRNTLSEADVAGLPAYVSGEGMSERPKDLQAGDIRTVVYVYAPADGRLVDWTMSDGGDFDTITTHDGLTVGARTVTLAPGESLDITVTVTSSTRATSGELAIHQTPALRDDD